jgi:hypothetical protein
LRDEESFDELGDIRERRRRHIGGSEDYGEGRLQHPLRPMRKRDFLSRNYKGLFLIPFILILVAVVIMAGSKYPNPPDEDRDEFNNIIGDVQNTANLVFTMGILSLAFLFLIAPFLDLEFHIALRIAMLLVGVVLITHFLTEGFRFQVLFG